MPIRVHLYLWVYLVNVVQIEGSNSIQNSFWLLNSLPHLFHRISALISMVKVHTVHRLVFNVGMLHNLTWVDPDSSNLASFGQF